jgi:hypothetical protein
MSNKVLELLVIEEKLKRIEREMTEERPFLQLEIEDYIETKQNESKNEPKRVIVIEL